MIKWHDKVRHVIWRFTTRKWQPGQKIPIWARGIFAILYPSMALRSWLCYSNYGYDFEHDIWVIHGKKYSLDVFRWLSVAEGQVFRVSTKNDVIVLEKLESSHSKHRQVK
jgi:hypothetical protein